MSKIQSPLLGYNNNVRHKNRVFHIQTEDSGIKKPHIITHLFMDGGRILKSVKTSYAEHLGAEGMSDIVKGMMKDQHKAMFIALRDGQFDHLVDGAGPVSGAAKVAAPAATPAAPTSSARLPEAAPSSQANPSSPAIVRKGTSPGLAATSAPSSESPSRSPDSPGMSASSAPGGMSPMPPPAGPRPPISVRSTAAFSATIPAPPPAVDEPGRKPMMTIPDEPPLTMRDSVPAAAPADEPSLTLDIDALERAQHDSQPFKSTENDLPPPPAALFKKPDTGRYRTLSTREEDTAPARQSPAPPRPVTGRPGSVRPPMSAPRPSPSPPRPPSVAAKKKSSRPPAAPRVDRREEAAAQRYAPARPAAIFGQARPQQGSSIFGEDLISDKSLDEVILSYLAEDLETDGGKK
ncbi:MAG: hypothetical protein JWM74_1629 [Myxococcaceae bacterium]|nr:hypothetical protein [Myxococcaceae bacterium]